MNMKQIAVLIVGVLLERFPKICTLFFLTLSHIVAMALPYGVRRLAAAFTAGGFPPAGGAYSPCGGHISRQRGQAPIVKAAASRRTPYALATMTLTREDAYSFLNHAGTYFSEML